MSNQLIYIYTLIVCLFGCLSVRLYPINVKTAEPIGPKFLWNLESKKCLSHFCRKLEMKKNSLRKQKRRYIFYTWSDKACKGTVVNLQLLSLHEGSLDIMPTVPFNIHFSKYFAIQRESERRMRPNQFSPGNLK